MRSYPSDGTFYVGHQIYSIRWKNAYSFSLRVHLEIGGIQQWSGEVEDGISTVWYLCTKMGGLELGCGRLVTVTIEFGL